MRLRHEDQLPSTTIGPLRRLCELLTTSLPALDGVILHGSAATSGFDPARSDLDVLAIVGERQLRPQETERLAMGLLAVSGDPHPLEISIVARHCLEHWQHPCPHLMHFGEEIRARFEQGVFNPESSTDEDLTMHMVVARHRGIDLLGSFPTSRLPEVARADFLHAVLRDFEWAQAQGEAARDYLIANACRTLAFLRDGLVLSKLEGRQWCEDRMVDTTTLVKDVEQKLRQEIARESN